MGKTDATTRRASERRLPDSKIACDGSDRAERNKKTYNSGKQFAPPLGTDGMTEDITLKGDFQRRPLARVSSFFRLGKRATISWLFGMRGPLAARDWCLVAYTSFLASVLAIFTGALLLDNSHYGIGAPWPVIALAASAVIAERQSVRLSPRAEISVSALPIILAAVIYGPLAAILVSIASLTPSFQPPYARWLTWTSTRSLAAGCAGLVAASLDGSTPHLFGRVLAAVAVATLVEQLGDLVLASVAATL